MTAYQNPTTLNSPSTYSNAYTVSSSCAYYSEPTVPHRFNTAGATADENISPTPTTDEIISLALSYNYVIGARAFEWQGSIILALITTPFILKSERDNAKVELKNDIIASTGYENIIVTFDGEVYRNIRDSIAESEKQRLFQLAVSRS